MIIQFEKMVEYDSQISHFDYYVILLSLTFIDKPLKSHFICGDLITIIYVFELLIFILLDIIHLLMSERQLFTFEIPSNNNNIDLKSNIQCT